MFKKNLFYNAVLSVSQFVFPLITFPYTTRILHPEGIGAVNFIDSFTQYFILFSALGVPVYGVREVAKRRHDDAALNQLFNEVFLLHVISTLIFSIVYVLLALFTPVLRSHFDLVFIGILLMFSTTLSVEWFYQGIEEFSYIAGRTLIIRSLSVLVLFFILKPGSSPWEYYAIITGIVFINGLSNLINLRKYLRLRLVKLNVRDHIKPLMIILGSSIAVTAYVLLDNVLLGFIKGVIAVGIYSTAIRIVRLPYAFINAINVVMIPEVSRSFYSGKTEQVKSCLNKSFAFICAIGMPVSIGIFICAPFIVRSFAGEQFMQAAFTLQIITPVIMLVGFNSILNVQLLTPGGHEKYVLYTVITGMLISVILNFCLIPKFSFIGAAITSVVTEIAVTALSFYFSRKAISELSFDLKIFAQTFFGAISFIPLAFFIRNLQMHFIMQEITVIFSCMVVYGLFAWFFIKNIYIDNLKLAIMEKFKR